MFHLPFLRRSVLLLLVAAFLLPGGNWPFREAGQHEASAAEAMTMGGMPCDEVMGMKTPPPEPDHGDPCDKDCCPQSFCDFSACLATGVLPSFAWMPPALPAASLVFVWHTAEPPVRPLETALRPPIA
jgi:hypothetical protein